MRSNCDVPIFNLLERQMNETLDKYTILTLIGLWVIMVIGFIIREHTEAVKRRKLEEGKGEHKFTNHSRQYRRDDDLSPYTEVMNPKRRKVDRQVFDANHHPHKRKADLDDVD